MIAIFISPKLIPEHFTFQLAQISNHPTKSLNHNSKTKLLSNPKNRDDKLSQLWRT